ncbi:uncharacterized protein I303_104062 [Kwoniella dejecticola CBS 10117]|uniref:RNA polymerase II subunit B1 CTD phosphatase RPAP2 homolog n=1 Tax=Kwoniella dejecticola CBS 10117 TaxID=1296121 RepID=A0A1A6A8H4_9TREE|nr:uncharacterized protein I303_04081 [Kwoniella dejecticola CBS 10117]OBR86357.1 hypothetical protein I303_04081 [Kwoniella dejecticola CBS 10117]
MSRDTSNRNAQAGSSSAHPTSRNPVRLNVSQRQTGQTSSVAGSTTASTSASTSAPNQSVGSVSENDTLVRAAVRKAQLQRRVDKWMDRSMEETVDRSTFKKVAAHLTPPQYLEVTHERHLNSLCSYPLCGKPPKREYSVARRFKISTTNRTIKEKEGNPEDGFCSRTCAVRSSWVERHLGVEAIWLRGEIKEFDLLEDLEERGEFSFDQTPSQGISNPTITQHKASVQSIPPISSTDPNGRTREDIAAGTKITPTGPPVHPRPAQTTGTPPKPTASSPSKKETPASNQPDDPITALIANLKIYERPTPSNAPSAPSLSSPSKPTTSSAPVTTQSQAEAHTTPLKKGNKSPSLSQVTGDSQSQSQSLSHSPKDARRAQSSLLGSGTNGLSNTFVKASKPLAHLAQDDSEEEEREESDWEKEMGWGEDDEEMRGFWEEARLAREIADEGDK